MEKTKIKPRGTIKVSSVGNANIPSQIRQELETNEIAFICDAKTALLFSLDTSYEDVLKSLEVLRRDLELRQIIEEGGGRAK